MKSMNKHLRTCQLSVGGCGKIYHTDKKYSRLCDECKKKRKREAKNNTLFENDNKTKFIKCGVCGSLYVATSIRLHIRRAHPKEYKKLMNNYYSLIENLEEIK